jgi:GNAT superfamily N-acetyltransferase
MDYRLESYTPEEREDYLRLLRAAWGSGALTDQEFDWWFADNPAGSLMSVARANGRVVGVASHSLFRMVLDGTERLAAFSVHATTDESARGQGIFPALERKHEEEAAARGAAVCLAFASKPTDPIFRSLGWTPVARLRVWARALPSVLRPRSSGAERVERFDDESDAARLWPNHVVRDARYLNWRYVDSPKGYECFRSTSGYCVLAHKRQRGQPIAVVADLVADDARPLLAACLVSVRRGTRALFALPARGQERAYARLGFVPTNRSLNFMGHELAGTLDRDPAAWRFTLGDTDFF